MIASEVEDAMGELISLDRVRRDRQLLPAVRELLTPGPVPDPATFGWEAVDWAEGRPVAWRHREYDATVAYVQGRTEYVRLTYQGAEHIWLGVTPEELIVDLETGFLGPEI